MEGARSLTEALAGVRRTSIEADESVGGRDRDGVPGGGASSGVAGNGNAWGPDDRAADAPPSRFGEGGLSSHPQVIIAYPWTAMAQTVGTKVEE